jgi:hypothetical protein
MMHGFVPSLVRMTNSLLAIIVVVGHATTYDEGLMESVSAYRGLPTVGCMVTSPFDGIGDWLLVRSRVTDVVLSCRVTDVSAGRDRARHRSNRLYEFDTDSWRLLCDAVVVGSQPWRDCPIDVYPLVIHSSVRELPWIMY